MRILTLSLLASALLLFGATSASAFAVTMTVRPFPATLVTSDTVTVDVFLDATGGITILSVGVLNSSTASLLYDGNHSANLAPHPSTATTGCFFAACTGAQPSYILYTAGRPATALYPLNSPYFLTFPAPPGTEQVNINYVESQFLTTLATGTSIYIATLVFHVVSAFASETISLTFTSPNLIQAGTFVVPPTTIGLSALDPSSGFLTFFNSTVTFGVLQATLAEFASALLAAHPGALNLAALPEAFGVLLPAVVPNRDGGGTRPGSGFFAPSGPTLNQVLTAEQQALLGCGAFYGTDCDVDGFDLLNVEASALFQSFAGFEGTETQRDGAGLRRELVGQIAFPTRHYRD